MRVYYDCPRCAALERQVRQLRKERDEAWSRIGEIIPPVHSMLPYVKLYIEKQELESKLKANEA